MNDYERLAQDVRQAIDVTEAAYYCAQDEEDQVTLNEALDLLKQVHARAEAKV
jgi:hypothetical protein